MTTKPLGGKAYGHISHLPGSRMGPGDHHCHEGQARIATEKRRDRHDLVILQEKLDGSCCAVAKLDGQILPLTRAGYLATTSRLEQHALFFAWAMEREPLFQDLLRDGERIVGEWLAQAHGTRYELPHEPFVAFDVFRGGKRCLYAELTDRFAGRVPLPQLLHSGAPLAVEEALRRIDRTIHGALDEPEGAVWRVERQGVLDFLVKYVRPDKSDGRYLPEINGSGQAIWNWRPGVTLAAAANRTKVLCAVREHGIRRAALPFVLFAARGGV